MSGFQVLVLAEAASEITHMSGSEGNESLVSRQRIMTDRGVVGVPFISGNSLRHRLVREPGWRYLIDRLGLSGRMSLRQLNFTFHGGSLTESTATENTRRIAEWQTLFPLGRLLGGCLPNQMLGGSLLPSHGMLVCEENRSVLQAYLPPDWEFPSLPLRLAETFVSGYQYVRNDAARTAPDLLRVETASEESGAKPSKSNQMIFSGQSVMPGATFLISFVIQHATELELGALLLALKHWQQDGGTVGGQGARGHGKLAAKAHVIGSDKHPGELVAAYESHVEANRAECVRWLDEVFSRPVVAVTKEKGKGKGKGKAKAEVVTDDSAEGGAE